MTVNVQPIPTASLSGPKGVVKTSSPTFHIDVGNNANGSTIGLLFSNTGNGRASFNGNVQSLGTSRSIDFTVKGTAVSSTADDITITATDQAGHRLATLRFSVISVTISSIKTSGPLSDDDAAATDFLNTEGTALLNGVGPGANGAEIKGVVFPSNFTDTIDLKQTKVSYACYADATDGHIPALCGSGLSSYVCPSADYTTCTVDDPGGGDNQDNAPAPNGNIYTWDAPGIVTIGSPGPRISRIRQNFAVFAVYKGVTASNVFTWFNASSAMRRADNSIGAESTYNSSGDNKAGPDSSKTSWNLQ